MKLLVFAHVPPPHHGQSYMVKLMLDGFGGDHWRPKRGTTQPNPDGRQFGIECYHVNARLSSHLEDLGAIRFGKLGLLLWYCLQAIWCRFRHGVDTFYYVPAPGKQSAIVRDWMVFALCRPFFKRFILHWHAAGMAKWIETSSTMFYRELTYRTLGQVDLCVVLSKYNYSDAEKLWPKRIRKVGNGIPDPCPDFEATVLPKRLARLNARIKLIAGEALTETEANAAGADSKCFNVLYLAHCIREKGLFDTLNGVALAAAQLRTSGSPIQIKLTVAGEFMNPAEETEFKERITHPDLRTPDGISIVKYSGFVTGERKRAVFLEADCFCFPTYYYAESFGLVVVEAMAFGVPIITSRWRSVPELLPADDDGLVEPRSPEDIAAKLLAIAASRSGEAMRQRFIENYRVDIHLTRLAEAIHSVETDSSVDTPVSAAAHA
jgi:glycosyltransferase involved in cell wall biosynthesis